jgi:DNA-binding beta-propeller fold protein YncE
MKPRFVLLSAFFLALLPRAAWSQGYHQTGTIKIGGAGGWDYLTADPSAGRLYVSHTGVVEVVDLASGKAIGQVSGLTRIHGIALATKSGSGFISDGGANQVVQFDLKTLAIQKKISAGQNPDGIVYDTFSDRVFAFNGRSNDASAINNGDGSPIGTVALGGKPEFPVADGKGSIFVNIEDKNEIAKIDTKSLQVEAHWPIAPCESPSGLAFDPVNRRLFAVCENKLMAVVDADSGKVVATVPIGDGPDAAAFDPETKLAFSSNGGSATLTVVRQLGKDKYTVAETVPTAKGARTMALDTKTHTIYLPTVDFGPPAKATGTARPRPTILPDTFKLLVFAPAH